MKFLILLSLFSLSVMAQPGGKTMNDQQQRTPQSSTADTCPFKVDMSVFIDPAAAQTLKMFADQLSRNNSNRDCNEAGKQLGDLLKNLFPPKTNNTTTQTQAPAAGGGMPSGGEAVGGMSGGEVPVGGGKPTGSEGAMGMQPPAGPAGGAGTAACTANPAACVAALTSVIDTMGRNANCGGGDNVLSAVVGAAGSLATLAGPAGTAISLAANLSLKLFQFIKNNNSAIGKARKLSNQDMLAMEHNIGAIMACQANDVYKEAYCVPMMAEMVRDNLPKTRGAQYSVPPATMEKVFICLMDVGGESASPAQKAACYKDVINPNTNAALSKKDMDKVQKEIDDYSASKEFLEKNHQKTFFEAGKKFHSDYLARQNSSLKKKLKDGKYVKREVRTEITLLVKSCYQGYLSSHVNKELPTRFTDAKDFSQDCANLFQCTATMGHPGKEIFLKNSEGHGDDRSVCYGIIKLGRDFDSTAITDDLLTAKFDNSGRCEKPANYEGPSKTETDDAKGSAN